MSVCKLLLAPGAILNTLSCKFGVFFLPKKSVCPLDSCRNEPFMDPFYQKGDQWCSRIVIEIQRISKKKRRGLEPVVYLTVNVNVI